ncbi:MAG: T9SS type A sorting domain-containing protein, partial [bacterium]
TGKDCDFGAGRIDAFAAVYAVPRGPVLEMRKIFLADSSGNNDGYIDPGERASLFFRLVNVGNAHCANTQGNLSSFDSRLLVLDSVGSWGNIAPNESAVNLTDRFLIAADTSLRQGTLLPCTLYVAGESADYEVKFGFDLRVGMPGQIVLDHDTNNCRLSITCLGAIGYLEPGGSGSGFAYPKSGPTLLRYASFAFGNDSGYVVDRYYTRPVTNPPDTEFVLVDSVRNIYPPQKGDEHFRAWYSDRKHPRSKPVVTIQNSYADGRAGYRDFVVVVYDVQNNSSIQLSNFYTGVFADFTIDSLGHDICRTDSLRRFIYMTDSARSKAVAGVKILEPVADVHLSAIDPLIYYLPDSSFRDAQKWRFLSGQVNLPNPSRADNWAVCAAAGPFTLTPFGACRFAVAFVGGETELAAKVNADSAQMWYHHFIGVEGQVSSLKPFETGFKVLPNPFARRVVIRYQVPVSGPVRMSVIDASGRVVERLMDGSLAPGKGELVWEPVALGPGVFFIRLETQGNGITERVLKIR